MATILVQKGTLHQGDIVIAGTAVGRVRVMRDDQGRNLKEAGPSTPVEITGLTEVPAAGDIFDAVEDEKLARELADQRAVEAKEKQFAAYKKVTLDNLFSQIAEGERDVYKRQDLLRLGLERGKTAYEAMHVIISLLEKYGQGGNAAVGKVFHYHNAFLIADPTEAWILDTVNRRWVARRVQDVAGISNCYSTTTQWDEASPDLQEHAYEMGWYPRELPFNFAQAYSAM